MVKLGIIGGAGLLGATTAFCVASEGLVDEIILSDTRDNLARSHAMDIEQAVCGSTGTTLSTGGPGDLKSCDIILNAAGIPEFKAVSRNDFLSGNIIIIRELADEIRQWGAAPVIINATNPVDVLNYSLFKLTGLPREKFIGFSRNDTLRFKWAVSKETSIPASQLDALVIGEHGDRQTPVFSRLRHKDSKQALDLSDVGKENIITRIQTWFGEYQKLDARRSSGWTSGASLSVIIKAILTSGDELLPCSVIPDGEYGLRGLSIGLPVLLGRNGVREIVEIDLSESERDGLYKAAEKIKNLLEC
jgi:malate/lactate dehydrogenase